MAAEFIGDIFFSFVYLLVTEGWQVIVIGVLLYLGRNR